MSSRPLLPSGQPAGPRASILVVDDELNIRTMLGRALALSGYRVDEAGSGAMAISMLGQQHYDLMVLDIQMPGVSGIEVMQRARDLRPELMIIVLTGHGSLDSAIAAIKTDAVDYLLKPAGMHEIVAAVSQALSTRSDRLQRHRLLEVMSDAMHALRTMESPAVAPADPDNRFLTAGPFTFDRQKRVLIWSDEAGRTAEFSEAEAAVLEVLMLHRDRVLTCHDMARLAWSYDLEEEEARGLLRQYVFRLRRKIEARPDDPAWIHTVRGRGYLFGLKDPGASTA